MKWKCPVCRQGEQQGNICSNCGFDRTLDLEKYNVITELSETTKQIFLTNYSASLETAREKGSNLWEELERKQKEIEDQQNKIKEQEEALRKASEKIKKYEREEEIEPSEPTIKKRKKFPFVAICAAFLVCGGGIGGYLAVNNGQQKQKNDMTSSETASSDIDATESIAETVTQEVSTQEISTQEISTQETLTQEATSEEPSTEIVTEKPDTMAPVMEGVENGKTYCGAQSITVKDDNLKEVTVNGTPVTLTTEGMVLIEPAVEEQVIEAVDTAENKARVSITVNNGHSYSNGICTICGQKDTNYTINEEAELSEQGKGDNGWYSGDTILKAPDGFYIAFSSNKESFGTETSIEITKEGSYAISYYLMNIESGVVSYAKSIEVNMDKTVPTIRGVQNGKTYYGEQIITVRDDNLKEVTVNGMFVELTNEGTFTIVPKSYTQTIKAVDVAGNKTIVRIMVKEVYQRIKSGDV